MRIDIITVLPEMLEGFFNCSIMSRAQKKGIAEFHIHNLRPARLYIRPLPESRRLSIRRMCGNGNED